MRLVAKPLIVLLVGFFLGATRLIVSVSRREREGAVHERNESSLLRPVPAPSLILLIFIPYLQDIIFIISSSRQPLR